MQLIVVGGEAVEGAALTNAQWCSQLCGRLPVTEHKVQIGQSMAMQNSKAKVQ